LIDGCLTPTLAIVQLYRGVKKKETYIYLYSHKLNYSMTQIT